MHNNFLDFIFQASQTKDEIYTLIENMRDEHIKEALAGRYQSMTNFLQFVGKRYKNIRGIL